MREIKFRAWSNDYNAYCSEIRYDAGIWDGYVVDETGLEHHTSDITIEQYTGLKDKHGKEVYEGDILKHHKHRNLSVVRFSEWQACFYPQVALIGGELGMSSSEMAYAEVIGNIHEDEELMR